MLNFYHDLGKIVKHGSTVVLRAEWLIDLFKQLITIPPFEYMVRSGYVRYINVTWRLTRRKLTSTSLLLQSSGFFSWDCV